MPKATAQCYTPSLHDALPISYEALNPVRFLARHNGNKLAKRQYLQHLETLSDDPDPLVRYFSQLALSEFLRENDKAGAAHAAKTAIQIAKNDIWLDIANSPHHFKSRLDFLHYRLIERPALKKEVDALIADALQEIYSKARASEIGRASCRERV